MEMCAAPVFRAGGAAWLLSRRPAGRAKRCDAFSARCDASWPLPARPLRAVPTVMAGAGCLAVVPAVLDSWTAVFSAPDGRLTVEMFDVGQGDSILIRTPDGQKLLVDGGPDGATVERALDETLPFWDRKLDMVLLTHTDTDHLTGLVNVVERYNVGQVIEAPIRDG